MMENELQEEIFLFSTLSLQLPPIPHQRKEISLSWVPLVRKMLKKMEECISSFRNLYMRICYLLIPR
ncbi:hypothetical protein V6N11_074211 [Hibiscus sabdariffa]|uniref:Uncharacterized protein n=2 Tax=Hibiscus sabdariffa TaxID=183260 RepID=A0ABR2NJU9_9ROSI